MQFKLIKPFVSDTIYKTSSINKASKRCYNEVKELNVNTFTMMNIDTKQSYVYKIHNKQIGGDVEDDDELVEVVDDIAEGAKKNTDSIKILQSKVSLLEKRISKLESIIENFERPYDNIQTQKHVNVSQIEHDEYDENGVQIRKRNLSHRNLPTGDETCVIM